MHPGGPPGEQVYTDDMAGIRGTHQDTFTVGKGCGVNAAVDVLLDTVAGFE